MSSGFTKYFNPRAPCGARRPRHSNLYRSATISIHAPRVGRDFNLVQVLRFLCNFNPRAPCGARRYPSASVCPKTHNFNPRAPCGARRISRASSVLGVHFNPRAPCGARRLFSFHVWHTLYFNPRAPCGARRLSKMETKTGRSFQSTRPVWGATRAGRAARRGSRDFNPRAPCGARRDLQIRHNLHFAISIHAPRVGRDDFVSQFTHNSLISIHAPRVGRDFRWIRSVFSRSLFQSTRPVWGATTVITALPGALAHFNPRAPCGARPLSRCTQSRTPSYFNPRAPCGARLNGDDATVKRIKFQSTRPVWGATLSYRPTLSGR